MTKCMCAIAVCALLAAAMPAEAGVIVPVANASFETVGDASVSGNPSWHLLPNSSQAGYAWVDGNTEANAIYELWHENLTAPPNSAYHFNAIPDGEQVLNVGATSPLTQDLHHAIAIGDTITMTFYVGNSKAQDDPAGAPTPLFTLNGSEAYSGSVTNTAANGEFVPVSIQWTATSAGNLGIKFTGGGWLDAVSVEVEPIPEPASMAMLGLGGVLLARRRV